MKHYFKRRDILKSMVVKNFKAKYVGSFLGLWWAIATPLLIMAAINFVFTIVWPIDIEHFPVFVLSALLPWIFFSSALSESTHSLVEQAPIIHQFIVPKAFIPLSVVIANFINFLFGLVVMIPIFIVFGHTPPGIALLFLPIVLVIHLIFTIGVVLLLSSLNVYVRDIAHLLGTILMFWFWMTPVFYSVDMIPEPYRELLLINPLSSILTLYRSVLFYGQLPDITVMGIAVGYACGIFLLGCIVFGRLEEGFSKRL